MSEVVSHIRSAVTPLDTADMMLGIQKQLDEEFGDLEVLLGHAGPSGKTGKRGKRRRGLKDEIAYWEDKGRVAAAEVEETSSLLPKALEETQTRLQEFSSSAQNISLERYALADRLANLVKELSSDAVLEVEDEGKAGQTTVLEQMESLQADLNKLEAGLAWASGLEQVVVLSERTLAPSSHNPSPLAALPHYTSLHRLVQSMKEALPTEMSLVGIISDIRNQTWMGLKEMMSKRLLSASDALHWPTKVQYHLVPPAQRRAFERAFEDLLRLQIEGERLGGASPRSPSWSSGEGLYPLQAMIQPIALRFKYHFQGAKSTNRVDKPEWAFANILDQIYEHRSFLQDYLQPLTDRAGYHNVDVVSEFTLLLFPTLLGLLRARIPRLLDHPALLAHTIYQTIVFDDAVREGGFDINAVSIHDGSGQAEWEGLSGVVLREKDWFEQWLAGERRFAEGQLNEIISAIDAWDISDDLSEEEGSQNFGLKPSNSARQVKALVEQITDRYSPLPGLEYKLPFLTTIQLPLLNSYQSRISGSLDAFETLSSAFVRAVPGALSGTTRGGVHIDQQRLTGGKAGLERLVKANISAAWSLAALKSWADDVFFVEISTDLRSAPQLRWKIRSDALLPRPIKEGDPPDSTASVFDVLIGKYEHLVSRSEDMIVRHVSVEVENDLKVHLTRRWDNPAPEENTIRAPDSSFVHSLTTYTAHIRLLTETLPPLAVSRLYRRIVSHLSNHIQQRAVYSGWSRFTPFGGKDFLDEILDFVHASENLALGDTPWKKLVDIGTVLSLPTNNEQGLPTFSQAMAVAWSDSWESLDSLNTRLGTEISGDELRGVLKRRVDCWK
ncbi:RAD50-interacting protein 1, partial [Tremellales sp. Uapishka_1]